MEMFSKSVFKGSTSKIWLKRRVKSQSIRKGVVRCQDAARAAAITPRTALALSRLLNRYYSDPRLTWTSERVIWANETDLPRTIESDETDLPLLLHAAAVFLLLLLCCCFWPAAAAAVLRLLTC